MITPYIFLTSVIIFIVFTFVYPGFGFISSCYSVFTGCSGPELYFSWFYNLTILLIILSLVGIFIESFITVGATAPKTLLKIKNNLNFGI